MLEFWLCNKMWGNFPGSCEWACRRETETGGWTWWRLRSVPDKYIQLKMGVSPWVSQPVKPVRPKGAVTISLHVSTWQYHPSSYPSQELSTFDLHVPFPHTKSCRFHCSVSPRSERLPAPSLLSCSVEDIITPLPRDRQFLFVWIVGIIVPASLSGYEELNT